MRDNFIIKHRQDGYDVVTWKLNSMFSLYDKQDDKLDSYRYKAWKSLNIKEKSAIIHTWEKADIQRMENEEGPVDTIAVMFETKNEEKDGFIIVYIDLKTKNITGSETFF